MVKAKLSNVAISGAPEDQLRAPLEGLISDIAEFLGLPSDKIAAVGETSLADLKTRPDYAVTLHSALVGFIEVKAPGKGADPRRFTNKHGPGTVGKTPDPPEPDLHRRQRLQPVARRRP